MKKKYFFILFFCFIIELVFSQPKSAAANDPYIYSNNPYTRWTFINNSSHEILITFKNGMELTLNSNGDYKCFSPIWLIEIFGYQAEDNYDSEYSCIYANYPNGKKYWHYSYFVPDQADVYHVENGSIITFYDDENQTYNKLKTLPVIQQPLNSNYCGVACIQMVENFYFNETNNMDNIWKKISGLSVVGRRVGRTYKMGRYLQDRELSTTIVRFSDFEKILYYCEALQIPAIMNIRAGENSSLGHYVVFKGYDSKTGSILTNDPAGRNTVVYNYNVLENLLRKISIKDEIGGNTVILTSNNLIIEKEIYCQFCHYKNVFDEIIIDAITGLGCIKCNRFFPIN